MSDYANLAAFLATLGQTASGRRPVKLAPGGVSTARPAPSRFKAEGGVSDSAFVKQIIDATSAAGGGSAALSSGGGMAPQMPAPPQMPQAPQQAGGQQAGGQQGGGLAALLAGLGGGG